MTQSGAVGTVENAGSLGILDFPQWHQQLNQGPTSPPPSEPELQLRSTSRENQWQMDGVVLGGEEG